MSGIVDRHSSSAGPHLPEAAPHGFWHAARQFLFGIIGLALITFAAVRIHVDTLLLPGVGPGTISLLF